uniref:2-oxoglutarate ferredoxin oxidoreductase, beta subunit n=1 Tax=Streptomyces sp. CNQ-418 TaxID=467194 RepID=J7H3R7_9ACTN|nr:2-oxoglutarate ferredoxin oxidoreductase, beta subunit [Streptomyces sp. CNQ-418]
MSSATDPLSAPREAGREPLPVLKAKDFKSDQEVRWCPGCGDYAILAAVQGFLPELGLRREKIVFVSGIGCSSRFPYYLNTYGFHSIHGRAPAIATGLAAARPDLSVWVVTGDGDALSIGGNHLIHALRRNVNLNILMFNNRIYGLTKGQYSPTSESGKVTKSTPMGSLESPLNPISLALGAEASFVARTLDSDRAHLQEVLREAAAHRGTSFVEIYQNCNIFNDNAYAPMKNAESRHDVILPLEHGKPVVSASQAVCATDGGSLRVVERATAEPARIIRHDAHHPDPARAFALSRLDQPAFAHVPVGIFRQVDRPNYEEALTEQIEQARQMEGRGELGELLTSGHTWWIDPEAESRGSLRASA